MPSDWKDTLLTLGAGALTALIGGISPALEVLVFVMVVDFLTGWIAAYQRKELSSRVGFVGITKKMLIMGVVALGFQLDKVLGTALLRDAAAYFYLANEALSIVENAGELGLPFPTALLDAIKALKGRSEGKEE